MYILKLSLRFRYREAPRGNKHVRRATITEKKRRSWNALEKLAIVLYQEKVCSVRSAASKFNIEPKQIRDWKARPHVKRLGSGRKAKDITLG